MNSVDNASLTLPQMQVIKAFIAAHLHWNETGEDDLCCDAFDRLRSDQSIVEWARS